MNKLLILLCLTLTGCDRTVTDHMKIARGSYLCHKHGGLYKLLTNTIETFYLIRCRDGYSTGMGYGEFDSVNDPLVAEYLKELEDKR